MKLPSPRDDEGMVLDTAEQRPEEDVQMDEQEKKGISAQRGGSSTLCKIRSPSLATGSQSTKRASTSNDQQRKRPSTIQEQTVNLKKVRKVGGLGPDPDDLEMSFGGKNVPTFKLDNANFYLNTIRRTDPNLKYFSSFFSRNFHCDECDILNGQTYTNPYSFDIVSLLNIGKIVYMGKVYTTDEPIRDALPKCA